MLFEQQISERRERGRSAIARILAKPSGQPFGDYRIQSASGKSYRVAMRGPGLFENFCSCPDFAVNTLGACKHIEGLLDRLRQRHGPSLDRRRYQRARAWISLHYGDRLAVRLRLPSSPSAALVALAGKYFDSEGLLRKNRRLTAAEAGAELQVTASGARVLLRAESAEPRFAAWMAAQLSR